MYASAAQSLIPSIYTIEIGELFIMWMNWSLLFSFWWCDLLKLDWNYYKTELKFAANPFILDSTWKFIKMKIWFLTYKHLVKVTRIKFGRYLIYLIGYGVNGLRKCFHKGISFEIFEILKFSFYLNLIVKQFIPVVHMLNIVQMV